jgi:hypothetical protein
VCFFDRVGWRIFGQQRERAAILDDHWGLPAGITALIEQAAPVAHFTGLRHLNIHRNRQLGRDAPSRTASK